MDKLQAPIRDVSDTARWVACLRARESQRPDALFRDPYAERLAGERGFWIADALAEESKRQWAWAARTYLFDKFLLAEIQAGADVVLNLAAGLDARPYRMELPRTLLWIEVDLPDILRYKEQLLASEIASCQVERIELDLSCVRERRPIFAELNHRAKKVVVIAEGLLLYFTAEAVASLAGDLSHGAHFQSWIIDLTSPGQLRLMQRTTNKLLSEAGATFKFGPLAGAKFFIPYGWDPSEVTGILKTAAEFNRCPSELLSLLPEPKAVQGMYPWSGVCVLKRR